MVGRSLRAVLVACVWATLAPLAFAQQRAADGVTINDEGQPQYSTFSLCAIDPATGQSGASVTTRVPFVGRAVPHVRAGVGAVCTQASTVVEYGPRGLDLLAKGADPQAVLAQLLADDQQRETRQVGVIDMKGRAAAHTGKQNGNWAGSRQGRNYTVQANIMVGPEVVDAVAATFESTENSGMPLAERMILAMEAGHAKGGDRRWGNLQSAAIKIADPNDPGRGGDYITLAIEVGEHPEPVAELKRIYYTTGRRLGYRSFSRVEGPDVVELKRMLHALGYWRPALAAFLDAPLPANTPKMRELQKTDPAQYDRLVAEARRASADYARDYAQFDEETIAAVDKFRADRNLNYQGNPAGLVDTRMIDALRAADVEKKNGIPAGGRPIALQNRIDVVTPAAPDLAAYGKYDVGARTMQVTDRNRPDILNTEAGGATARYDRTLTLEVWYPATLAAGQKAGGEYRVTTRDPAITATLYGKAVRDAAPVTTDGPFPLVIISHGYPGNRFLMSHIGENLASKGFVAVSIDHKDSTYDDQKSFASTLYNRPFDQLFVLNEVARLGTPGSGSFLGGLVNADRTGLVGYSMGGYGVVNVVGGGYSKASETLPNAPPNRLLADRGASNPDFQKSLDPRIKAAIAIAPWGMPAGFWDAEGLKGIRTPIMFVAGSVDDVAGYEKGAKAIYQHAVNADRYLLTFVNANHNAAAPIPAPAETYTYSPALKSYPFMHYADAVWDTTRMNNVLDHFATAYFGLYLKGEQDNRAYLEPAADAWKGFKPRTAVGLTLEHATPEK